MNEATIMKPVCMFRVVRDDGLASFSADFRKPDILQQAWQDVETGEIVEWRDVPVIMESKLKEQT